MHIIQTFGSVHIAIQITMVETARESETTAPADTGKHGVREGNEETQTCKWHNYGKMGYCEVTVHFGKK